MIKPISGLLPLAATVLALAAAVVGGASASPPQPSYDETEPAWFSGETIQIFVKFPTGPPAEGKPSVELYLIGPVDAGSPQDPGGVFPGIIIPVHDLTFPRRVPGAAPANCFGNFVVAGSAATADTVHTRTDPNGSGVELAYEIRIGNAFRPLSSASTIRHGLAQGLLALESIGFGGTCWTAMP